jgi:aspartyl-tRNA(Asn)/glutamyl-tRNA(Gln) amidotransferase subunit A
VAAGLCPIAITTDGGGSTRRPAAHVGVVGMKPSAGLVPHPYGFEEPVFGNSVVGQMARSVGDIAMVLAAVAGPHRADPMSLGAPASLALSADARALRVAFSPRLGLGFAVDPDVAASVRSAVERLALGGTRIEEADPEWPEGTSEQALMPLQLAGLAALYGERYSASAWDVDPDIGAQIEAGLRTTGAEVARALLFREELYRRLESFFRRYDLLITPTVPCTAWPIGQPGPAEIEGRAVAARAHAVFTPIFNHTYLPGVSVPCGFDRHGLPIGLQIVAPRFEDASVLALAARVEAGTEIDFGSAHEPRVGATSS